MQEKLRIPGTSWLVEAKISPKDQKTIELIFYKGANLEKSYILDKDGSIEDIFQQFSDSASISIPKTRIETVLRDIEKEIYDLKKKMQDQGTSEQKTLLTMINLKEVNDKKIIITGLANAGKTSIYQIIFEGKNWWDLKPEPTRGIKRYKHGSKVGQNANLVVWDLGGQESYINEYHENASKIYSSTNVLIYVLDAFDPANFEKARKEFAWSVEQMKKYSPEGIIFCLIHKMDKFSNREETFERVRDYLNETINLTSQKITILPTSIMNDTIYVAWEQLFKTIIPKSKKLNILAENLRERMGIYNVLVLEKRTGFPICSSSTIFDDVVLVGTINKIWEGTLKLIRDLDLVNLEHITVKCENGFLSIEEIHKDTILMLISPDISLLEKPKNIELLNEFKIEMKKYI